MRNCGITAAAAETQHLPPNFLLMLFLAELEILVICVLKDQFFSLQKLPSKYTMEFFF